MFSRFVNIVYLLVNKGSHFRYPIRLLKVYCDVTKTVNQASVVLSVALYTTLNRQSSVKCCVHFFM